MRVALCDGWRDVDTAGLGERRYVLRVKCLMEELACGESIGLSGAYLVVFMDRAFEEYAY